MARIEDFIALEHTPCLLNDGSFVIAQHFGFQNPVRVAKIHVKEAPFPELFDESGEIPPNYPMGSRFLLAVRGCSAKNLQNSIA